MLHKKNDDDQGGGGGADVRAKAIELIEERDYEGAIRLLESPTAAPSNGAVEHELLGVAYLMLERYDVAADRFERAAGEVAAVEARTELERRARLARAHHAAHLRQASPPVPEFDAREALAPPALTDADLPAPPPKVKRTLFRRIYGVLGQVEGSGLDFAWRKLAPVVGRLRESKKTSSLWTTWDQQWLPFGLVTLAHIRDQLEKNNLKNPYPKGELTAFQHPVVPAPAATAYYRTPDGSYNDPTNPREGSTNVRFPRNVDDRVASPEPEATLDDPSVARISEELLSRPSGVMQEVPFLNLLAAAWIQFMVHDWVSHRTYTPDDHAHVVRVADDLPYRKRFFQRDMRIGKTMPDPTRQPADSGRPPTTLNEVTSWWDGSQLYGSDARTTASLRSHVDGKLKLDGDYLPRIDGVEHTGYNRNWWLGLSVLHTLFVKEHNAICDRLKEQNPTWDDERLFQVARLVNAAVLAKIHTVEWTPAILPNATLKVAMEANWFGVIESRLHRKRRKVLRRIKIRNGVFGGLVGNPVEKYGVPYGLSEEFVEVYRLHELLPDWLTLSRVGRPGAEEPPLMLAETRGLHAPKLVRKFGVANVLASFGKQHPGAITLHNYPQSLREIAVPGAGALDVAAVDILRARERGVPRYNAFRRALGLTPIRDFRDLTDDEADADALRRIYGDVERIDMQVGTRAESHRPKGFGFGETLFQIFIVNASRRLQADHFFTDGYNAETYTQAGLDWIDEATFKSVLLRHYPELALTNLANVENAFEPWDPADQLTEERHPLRHLDQQHAVHAAIEGAVEGIRDALLEVKSKARRGLSTLDALQTRVRAIRAGASAYDPLPPGSFGLPLFGESFEFLKGSGPFLEKRYRQQGPVFMTHVAFSPTVCIGGKEAYPLFMNEETISRIGGAPKNVQWLFDTKSLSFKDGDALRAVQARLLAAFDDAAMSTYMPALNRLVSLALARWTARARFAWVPELSTFSFGAIRTAFMGEAPSVERGFWTEQFELLTNGVVRSFFSPELYVALVVRRLFKGYVDRVIERKRENPGPDVVSNLLRGDAEGRLSEDQLRVELVHFFLAGAPLEAALAYHLLLLAQNPDVMERCRAEVHALSHKHELSLEDVESLRYVRQACKESRRAARLVPNTFFGKVKKPVQIGPYQIPAGWKAMGLIGATQHDGVVFRHSDRYDPSRFDDGDPPLYVAHGGKMDPHHCIGERFTDVVMTLLTARLLQAHTWEIVPGQDLGPKFGKVAPVPRDGLEVIFHPRRERSRRG